MLISNQYNNQPYFGMRWTFAAKFLPNDLIEFIENSDLNKAVNERFPKAVFDVKWDCSYVTQKATIHLGVKQLDRDIYLGACPDNTYISTGNVPEGRFYKEIKKLFSSTEALEKLESARADIIKYNKEHKELTKRVQNNPEFGFFKNAWYTILSWF